MLFSVLNINSGLALTHGNPRQAPFKNLQEQRFDLRVKPGEDGDNGVVILAVDTDSDDILTVSGCSEWLLETVESGYVVIKSFKEPKMVLGVVDSSMKTNAQVALLSRQEPSPSASSSSSSSSTISQRHAQWRLTPTSRVLFPLFAPREMEEFTCDYQQMNKELPRIIEDHGFCVVENVLTSSEVKEALAAWGRDLLGTLDYAELQKQMDSDSFDAERKQKLQQVALDLQNEDLSEIPNIYPGVGQTKMDFTRHSNAHGEFAWMIRCNTKVRDLFKNMYQLKENESNLVVGMDAVFFNPRGASGAQYDNIWGHADQNTHEPIVADWNVYQGVVALWNIDTSACSTTVIWPGSHKHAFDKLMESPKCDDPCPHPGGNTPCARQFVELNTLLEPSMDNTREAVWLNERYVRESRRVPMKAGSVIIWNSRTMHQGWNKGPRLAVPVCWEPRKRRNEQTYYRKLRLCATGLPTTHWASLGRQHNMNLAEAHDSTPLEFDFFTIQSREYRGDDIILRSSILTGNVGNINAIDLRLPRRTRLPRSLRQDMDLDFYRDVVPLCKALEESADTDANVARLLEIMIKPEIIAII